MKPRLVKKSKGRWSIMAPSGHRFTADDLNPLTTDLCKVYGVKRAIARANYVYLRVDETVRNLDGRIRQIAGRFFSRFIHPDLQEKAVKERKRRLAPQRRLNRRRNKELWRIRVQESR